MPLRLSNPVVAAVLRDIRRRSDHHIARGMALSPPGGTIPVGGAHIDEFARGWGLCRLLAALGQGCTPAVALEEALGESRLWFENWNRRRKDYQVHRWVQGADSTVEYALRKILQANRSLVNSRGADEWC